MHFAAASISSGILDESFKSIHPLERHLSFTSNSLSGKCPESQQPCGALHPTPSRP